MRFRSGAGLDSSQVSDRRGRGGPVALGGGGLIGIVVLLFTVFAGGDPSQLTPQTTDQNAAPSNLAAECQTGADANSQADCRIVGVVNSVQAFWASKASNYTPAQTVFFTGATNTACGAATADVGPFYCPGDTKVYIDLSFYDDLRSRFGATGGPFAEAYVIAHEYGHHIEDLTGVLDRYSDGSTGASSNSVRVELMADCYAGMWAKGATETQFIEELTPQDITDGLNAAAAVGDDRIQQQARGGVNKEAWTHGSAEQRQRWFNKGFVGGATQACDTFSATTL